MVSPPPNVNIPQASYFSMCKCSKSPLKWKRVQWREITIMPNVGQLRLTVPLKSFISSQNVEPLHSWQEKANETLESNSELLQGLHKSYYEAVFINLQ